MSVSWVDGQITLRSGKNGIIVDIVNGSHYCDRSDQEVIPSSLMYPLTDDMEDDGILVRFKDMMDLKEFHDHWVQFCRPIKKRLADARYSFPGNPLMSKYELAGGVYGKIPTSLIFIR
jgi:hypothetical protein